MRGPLSVASHSRMKSSLLCLLALTGLAHGAGKELEGTRAAANTPCPSPEEARAKMSVPSGYEVRNFAHEPMVVNPVAMTWDARGRLWVVEGYEYPEGSPFKTRAFGGEAKDDAYHAVPAVCQAKDNPLNAMRADHPQIPKDRVVILEDTDNDGVADKRTVFLQGLDMGSAILCGDGGIYVGQQPHLLHFRDNDGDDHADEWRVVLTGFGREDTHELLNSFCWGPDGWLYMTHGVFTNSKVRRPGVPEKDGFKFDAGIGRCRPVTQTLLSAESKPGAQTGVSASPWEFEVFADGTSNPWGCDYDARGNFFVSACVIDHFFHMAPGGIYVRQGGAPENPYAYEQLPSIVTHKHFRAAYAGVQIYQGGVYPQDTWGHAFIGNIHDNAVHEEVLTPVGSTFKCEPRRDFIRANDGWFRPVSTQTGPDGNLWVMDWCDKYPCYQNAKANPEGVDRERGRIWRIVATTSPSEGEKSRSDRPKGASAGLLADHSRPDKDMDLAKLSTPELVKLLEHPNNWMRRRASRLIAERWNGEWSATTKPPPHEIIAPLLQSERVETRMAAAWTLTSCDDVTDRVLSSIVSVKDAGLRSWAARAIGERFFASLSRPKETRDYGVIEDLQPLLADPDETVRLSATVALRQYFSGKLCVDKGLWDSLSVKFDATTLANHRALVDQLFKASASTTSQVLALLLWQSMEESLARSSAADVVNHWAELAPQCRPLSHTLTYKSMRRLCDTRDAKNLDLCLGFLAKIKAHDVLLAHALDGLVKGQEGGIIKPTKPFSALFAEQAMNANADVRKHAKNLAMLWGDPAAIQGVADELLNAKLPEAQRLAALASLRKVRSEAARVTYAQLLTTTDWKAAPDAFAIDVMRAGADLGGDDLVKVLGRTGILPVASPAGVPPAASGRIPDAPVTGRMPVLLAAYATLTSRADWTHQLLDHLAAAKATTGFPVSLRRQLATSPDKAIRDHAFKVLGAWKDSSDDIKALIAAKKAACLTGEPDLAAGKFLFTTTCSVCHTFHGGGQKVGPELIGSGRSNLDALLANVIDPNQIIGNGYENVIVTTKDNRTLMGRITEDTPSHVKLLAIGGAESTVPRDQIAKLENTHQSLMPMGFGGLPDDQFRNLIWYVLAPPEEGPLTVEKKKLLSTSIDSAPAKPTSKRTDWRSIDWESVSLWNPKWKVTAPEFEGTPTKRDEYHERRNVLTMHPFEDRKTPSVLETKLTVDAARSKLKFGAAADDRGDWQLRVLVNNKEIKRQDIGHDSPRWKDITVDLAGYAGKEVTVRLEGHATGWSYEFSYWDNVRWE